MSDVTPIEKRKFERLLEMGGGYVLNFSDRTFGEFVLDTIGRDIFAHEVMSTAIHIANRFHASGWSAIRQLERIGRRKLIWLLRCRRSPLRLGRYSME
jgi:hypothetical protein